MPKLTYTWQWKEPPIQPPGSLQHTPAMTTTDLPLDPWTNRSEGMRCRTCLWFVPKGDDLSDVGRCRRHAPTMNGYPVVLQSDWCGDHRLNERVRLAALTGSNRVAEMLKRPDKMPARPWTRPVLSPISEANR